MRFHLAVCFETQGNLKIAFLGPFILILGISLLTSAAIRVFIGLGFHRLRIYVFSLGIGPFLKSTRLPAFIALVSHLFLSLNI